MGLPKLIRPEYTYIQTNPLNEMKFKYSPYVNNHEVLLAEAKSGSEEDRKNAILTVLKDCVDGIDVNKLPFYIIEQVFLFIHAKSVGETHKLSYKCKNNVENTSTDTIECGNPLKFELNFMDFELVYPKEFTTTFDLGGGVGIKFAPPSFETYKTSNVEKINDVMAVLKPCIESIFDKDTVYLQSQYKSSELDEFLGSIMPMKKIEMFKNFFTKMPHIQKKVEIVCEKCNYKHEIIFNSVEQVFR